MCNPAMASTWARPASRSAASSSSAMPPRAPVMSEAGDGARAARQRRLDAQCHPPAQILQPVGDALGQIWRPRRDHRPGMAIGKTHRADRLEEGGAREIIGAGLGGRGRRRQAGGDADPLPRMQVRVAMQAEPQPPRRHIERAERGSDNSSRMPASRGSMARCGRSDGRSGAASAPAPQPAPRGIWPARSPAPALPARRIPSAASPDRASARARPMPPASQAVQGGGLGGQREIDRVAPAPAPPAAITASAPVRKTPLSCRQSVC